MEYKPLQKTAICSFMTCDRSSLSQVMFNITLGTDLTIHNKSNNSNFTEITLPREMIFTADSLVSVVTYSILFAIAAIGNLSVLIILYRKKCSRVNLFIIHLCLADLIVTFIMLPIEIGWHITVSWKAGDLVCRLLMFFRAFGLYLSSFIIIVISLDRYLAVVHPLRLGNVRCRRNTMLGISWALSAIASAPQSAIFHEEEHPIYIWYKQCVTFNFFPSESHELGYNLFSLSLLYLLPLLVILFSYSLILFQISKKTKPRWQRSASERRAQFTSTDSSSLQKMQKARNRTLKMTVFIVLVFLTCWTPYYVMSAWWWFDSDGAQEVDPKIQRGLFIFAVSSACVNPIVYGMFTTAFQNELNKFTNWISSCYLRGREEPNNMVVFTEKSNIYYNTRISKRKKYIECYFNGYPVRIMNKDKFHDV